MISVSEALATVLGDLPRLGGQQVDLAASHGRVLAENIRSARDVPPFRNSAMDGYAVRAADLTAASPRRPVTLRLLEVVGAGSMATRKVESGTTSKVMTGSLLPVGADAVVRLEDTSEDGEGVKFRTRTDVGANVREAGEDVRAGEEVLSRGRLLRAADIGLLASLGVTVVRVARRPRVAILTTGNELVEPGEPLGPGQIVNSNAYALAAAVQECGGEPVMIGIVRDEPERLQAAFADAFSADVVLSTGGVSVGSFDYVRRILQALGYQERFWKVAQKPGKPLTFGLRHGVPTFGLPGNPVSSLVCFYLYVGPTLRKMMGMERVHAPIIRATVSEPISTVPGLTEFIRCVIEGDGGLYRVHSTGTQSSGVLRSLSTGEGLLVSAPEQSQIAAGTSVRVILLDGNTTALEPPV
jgi:molybdopterin molybdotransferase